MFASLIRRKRVDSSAISPDGDFDSTTVSLSTAVPRPFDRRTEERISPLLQVGKLTMGSGEQQLIKVRNLSAGGLSAIVAHTPEIGEAVNVELSS